MVLLDSGAEVNGYSSDCTRTFPVSGKFTKAQKQVYNTVLALQLKLISKCRPGFSLNELDTLSKDLLQEGLDKLGIETNPEACKMWKSSGVHYIGHWVGMDIHDTNSVKFNAKFRPGMCIAVEPGLYLPAHPSIPKKYHNVGVRIEDTVHITEGEAEVLTAKAPKRVADIETTMRRSSKGDDMFKGAKGGIWNPDDDVTNTTAPDQATAVTETPAVSRVNPRSLADEFNPPGEPAQPPPLPVVTPTTKLTIMKVFSGHVSALMSGRHSPVKPKLSVHKVFSGHVSRSSPCKKSRSSSSSIANDPELTIECRQRRQSWGNYIMDMFRLDMAPIRVEQ